MRWSWAKDTKDMAESAMAIEDRGKDAALEAPAAKKPKTREAEELLYVMRWRRCMRLRFVGAWRPEGGFISERAKSGAVKIGASCALHL